MAKPISGKVLPKAYLANKNRSALKIKLEKKLSVQRLSVINRAQNMEVVRKTFRDIRATEVTPSPEADHQNILVGAC